MKEAHFNAFTITMTLQQARRACHVGDCYDDVMVLSRDPAIRPQLDALLQYDMLSELEEYGAWEGHELDDVAENKLRILWIAAGRILEDEGEIEHS